MKEDTPDVTLVTTQEELKSTEFIGKECMPSPEEKALKRKFKQAEKAYENRIKDLEKNLAQNLEYIDQQERDLNQIYKQAVTAESKLSSFVKEVGKTLDHIQDTVDMVRKNLQFLLLEMEKITKTNGDSNGH